MTPGVEAHNMKRISLATWVALAGAASLFMGMRSQHREIARLESQLAEQRRRVHLDSRCDWVWRELVNWGSLRSCLSSPEGRERTPGEVVEAVANRAEFHAQAAAHCLIDYVENEGATVSPSLNYREDIERLLADLARTHSNLAAKAHTCLMKAEAESPDKAPGHAP
jgi:hypothetical protein